MKYIDLIARILLGLIFVVFGINGLLKTPLIPLPAMSGHAKDFITVMQVSGYLTVVKVLEVLGGLLVLSGLGVNLGLLMLGPVVVNILLFHLFLDKKGLPMAAVLSGCLLILVLNRKVWMAVLKS